MPPDPTPSLDGAAAITLRGVRKHYGAHHGVVRAVDGVDLAIAPGELFGLIGHNGAGKSTLFKMMLGLVPATAGEIRVAGADVRDAGFRAARRRLGYLPENVVLWDNLTGLETLRFFARLKGVDQSECTPVLARVGLADAAERAVRGYSKGMRQRLGFAQALLGRPRVLFLDEPTTGLDPLAIRDFHASLRALREQGVTIVLSSHILAELQERVDRLAILSAGRVRALGTVQSLREQHDLPLAVTVRVAEAERAAVAGALDGVPGLRLRPRAVAQGWQLDIPRTAKMALLRTLAPLGSAVQDVSFTEPTLEDMFFGLAQRAEAA
ncbi:ABC transporter ATP-binding protein [Ideonella sp.]|uniref:ABC transporter ATP-binding protein n=1 Tax=Ideonella sp. TaxID=1929293 RepID=UPI002B466066|nr:ABC transporter ATP-binding protein [Ideonella sp.]HJV68416.1 ABC transporter ATP-binding protein [Ideonella sp.]